MSARAVAVIRPAPSIISLPAFLYILSGKRQLHAYQDSETGLFRRSKFCRLLRSALGLTKEGIELSAIQEAATENYGLNLLRIMDISQGIGS
jgi:hypothetical protein